MTTPLEIDGEATVTAIEFWQMPQGDHPGLYTFGTPDNPTLFHRGPFPIAYDGPSTMLPTRPMTPAEVEAKFGGDYDRSDATDLIDAQRSYNESLVRAGITPCHNGKFGGERDSNAL